MSVTLRERLRIARERQFVGRADELALFQAALTAAEPPFYVLYLSGPGGVGKTTLVREFAARCHQQRIPAWSIDARSIEPSPDAFLCALQQAMVLAPSESPVEALATYPDRQVVFIDTYETLIPLDEWLRDIFLPQLPEDVLVVLAGREPPSLAWHTDPGWQLLVRVLPLRNLSPAESRTYLTARAVPDNQHQAVLDFTHGYPLALSLIADVFAQRPGFHFQPGAAPDVIRVLLEQFVQKVPGPAHRAALEACAMVRLTTEALLAELLAVPDAHELFVWLRGLSFIESGPQGLFPHDLAREALALDLRWRNPDQHATLRRHARSYYTSRLQQTHGLEQQQILFDYIYLHRTNPIVRPFYEWRAGNSLWNDTSGLALGTAREDEWPALLTMTAHHEGEESARLAAHWFRHQPHGVLVIRVSHGPVGFLLLLALHQLSPEELDRDPAVSAAWRYLQQVTPLRPGEGATLFRFWMAHDTYQNISPVQGLIGVTIVWHYLTTPGLAFSFFPCAAPEFWAPLCAYADLVRIPEADFVVGERPYGVYGHDWRSVPPPAWLALLAEREDVSELLAMPPPTSPQLLVLSQPDFGEAVRDALRNLARLDGLRDNPLLHSRLVVERAGATAREPERIAALQALIQEACATFQDDPRDLKTYRAVHHTYLQPAPTQEQVAELLNLPFGTYRRHLKVGTARVVETLWRRELRG